jgi:hypothetical protein
MHENLHQRADQGSPNFLWQKATPVTVGWWAPRVEKVTISGVANRLNYCYVFTAYTQFTNEDAG